MDELHDVEAIGERGSDIGVAFEQFLARRLTAGLELRQICGQDRGDPRVILWAEVV
jgi:hypothetical protein